MSLAIVLETTLSESSSMDPPVCSPPPPIPANALAAIKVYILGAAAQQALPTPIRVKDL